MYSVKKYIPDFGLYWPFYVLFSNAVFFLHGWANCPDWVYYHSRFAEDGWAELIRSYDLERLVFPISLSVVVSGIWLGCFLRAGCLRVLWVILVMGFVFGLMIYPKELLGTSYFFSTTSNYLLGYMYMPNYIDIFLYGAYFSSLFLFIGVCCVALYIEFKKWDWC